MTSDSSGQKDRNFKLESFFSLNLDLLCIADLEGYFIKLNKSWENILGYSVKELQKKIFLEFVHPDDMESTLNAMKALGENKPVINFINRYRCKDNTYKYIEWRSQPYEGMIYAAARDITDKIQKQIIIEEQEENFRTFFETIDDLIFVTTEQGMIINTNRAVTEKLGYSAQELKTMHVIDVHPEIYRTEAIEIFADMAKGLRDFCPLPLKKKDLSRLPVETRVWPGKWDGIDCIYGISKDLSKQQAALEMFHRLFNSNPALMAVSSLTDRVFIEVNDAFLSKLGYAREEILGKTSEDLDLFVDREKHKKIAEELLIEGHVRDEELKIRKKDGGVLTGLFSGEVIDNQGTISFLTVMVDITKQKQQEEEMSRKEKMLSAVAASMKHLIDERDYFKAVSDCFEMLGSAIDVDRISLNKNKYDKTGKGTTTRTIKWSSDIRDSQRDKTEPGDTQFEEIENFITLLKNGSALYGVVRELENDRTREYLKSQDVLSTVVLPIFVKDIFWGFIEFDEFKYERTWTEGEFSTLNIFTRALESTIERSRAENELNNAKMRMKAILDNLPFLAWLKDKEGQFLETNRAFQTSCGMEGAEIIGKTDFDVWPAEQAEKYRADDEEVMRSGMKKSVDELIADDQLGGLWFETYKTPIYDIDGELIGTTGMSKDITERQEMISQIEAQKNFFKQMINVIPDLIFYKDTNSVYLGCNKAFAEEFIGIHECEIIGKTDLDFVEDTSMANFFREMDKIVLDSGQPNVNEEDICMYDGREITVETIKTPFYNENGDVAGLIGIARDISQRIAMRDSLIIAKKQADSANSLKSQFLANMSHEIRTPMNGIIGFLDLLQGTNLTSEQKEYFRGAKSASSVLLYLINDILDFSRIEAGKLSLEKISFPIRAIVQEIASLGMPFAAEKQIGVHVYVDSKVPEEIIGDPTRLRQIINNLVSNAIKFTENGEINIYIKTKESIDNRVKLEFQVQDTGIGIGISDEAMAVLFKPFIQADNSITRKFGGTGLGLAISYELVKMMDGEIGVESILGEGSTFTFYIYADVADSIDAPEVTSEVIGSFAPVENENIEDVNALKPEILLAEDNEINRKLVVAMLKQKGYSCDIAVDGAEALKAAASKKYDIIFMDCQMPIMDGYQSTAKIREIEEGTRHTKIVAMTANALEGDREKCLDAGMDDYISKPLNVARVFKIIEDFIRNQHERN